MLAVHIDQKLAARDSYKSTIIFMRFSEFAEFSSKKLLLETNKQIIRIMTRHLKMNSEPQSDLYRNPE